MSDVQSLDCNQLACYDLAREHHQHANELVREFHALSGTEVNALFNALSGALLRRMDLGLYHRDYYPPRPAGRR